MILYSAALVWLAGLAWTSLAPGLDRQTRRERQLDFLAVGALALATLGFFWRLLFDSTVWMPAGGGDLAGFIYPTYRYVQSLWQSGTLPLWNPYLFGGMPLLADIQSAALYPPNLLTFFLTNPLTYRDLEYLSVLHFALAGVGMYAFLRSARLRPDGQPLARLACLAGALAFEFSDLFVTHFGNLNLIATAAYLPLILLFLSLALDRNRVMLAVVGGVLLALAFFAGHVQPFLFILLTLGLYFLFRVLIERAAWPRAAFLFGVMLAVGVGLSAVTLLPALELTQQTVRSQYGYEQAAQYSLPPLELIGMLVPGFFGRGPQAAWGPWERVEVGYIGVLPLLLAALALVLRRDARTRFFALLALAGLALALGGYAILHGWLYQFVPGFGQLRAPARFILLLDFGLAVLAGLGLDTLLTRLAPSAARRLRVFIRYGGWISLVVAAAALALALGILILGQGQDPALFARIANAGNALAFFVILLTASWVLLLLRRTRSTIGPAWGAAVVVLVLFDLFSLGAYTDMGLSDPTLAYQRPPVIDFLRANLGLARIDSHTDAEGLWRPDTGLLYGFQDVYGDNPLVLQTFDRYWEALGGRDTPAYDLLNVKYVIVRSGTPLPPGFQPVLQASGGLDVYENTDMLPRAWLVHRSQRVPDSEAALQAVLAPDFQPHEIVVLTEESEQIEEVSAAQSEQVRVTGYGPNRIILQVDAAEAGYVVLSEVWTPGWSARVDAQPQPVLRANYLFRAVPVPAGSHTVELEYLPLSFQLGAAISAVTLLACLFAFVVSRRSQVIAWSFTRL